MKLYISPRAPNPRRVQMFIAEKGIAGIAEVVVEIGKDGVTEKDILVYDETMDAEAIAFLLSRLTPPHFPTPIGIFRAAERPLYESGVHNQIKAARDKRGPGNIEALLKSGDTWEVR